MEYIQDVKLNNGRFTRKLFYKPDNRKNYVSMTIVREHMTPDNKYLVGDIEHNLKLPDDVRPMLKSEYSKSILNTLDFIDNMS